MDRFKVLIAATATLAAFGAFVALLKLSRSSKKKEKQLVKRRRNQLKKQLYPQQPRGLINVGNSCYINSVLQALSASSNIFVSFINSVVNLQRNDRKNNSINRCLHFIQQFQSVVTQLQVSNERPLNPFDFLQSIIGKQISYAATQEDAHEFLIFLLNLLQTTYRKAESAPIGLSSLLKECRVKEAVYNVAPWYGIQRQVLQCLRCKTSKEPTFIPFNIISMDVSALLVRSSSSSVESFLSSHDFVNEVYCKNCNGKRGFVKVLDIVRRPRLLIVYLERNEFCSESKCLRKNTSKSILPLKLTSNVNGEEYQLVSLIEHIGQDMTIGHYVTYKKFKDSWFLTSDENVQRVSLETVSTSTSAYLIFYERLNSFEIK